MLRIDPVHPAGQRLRDAVICESPLTIRVDGTSYTLLRTPGHDRELAVGFLLTEGLIGGLDDLALLGECPDAPDLISVQTSAPVEKPRRTLVMTSSCGLCGRERLEELIGSLGRVDAGFRMPLAPISRAPAQVRSLQPLFGATGGAHASALIRPDGRIPCVREDVGRHNAMDKLIGHALLNRLPFEQSAVFLSGRISIEMIVKAARARIPILAAVGAPPAAAVEAAERTGIMLCGFLRDERISVYANEWRIAEAG